MATPFHLPVTVAQVGTYFVGQYYHILQHQPDCVHQFYNDASTMLRFDGSNKQTASTMLHIHTLVMSLNYSKVEIRTAHSLESWNGGVLVMASGSIQIKDFNGSRKFVETFFLAPQEKGYFVLNDIFHFINEEPIRHPVAYLSQSNLEPEYNISSAIREQVPSYLLGRDIQIREFVAPGGIGENGAVDSYSFQGERHIQVPEADNILEDDFVAQQSNGSLHNIMNYANGHFCSSVEEPVGEPQKHTYASILQVAKGQSASSVVLPSNKATHPASEGHQPSESATQQAFGSSRHFDGSGADALEESSAVEDEVEVKSVYVRNVPLTMSASEIEEEFKKFGKLRHDGVAIRTRKDIDVCYAFVEFEDVIGVQNAILASTVLISGHQLYIEGRRPSRGISYRGRGRGRCRINYMTEAPRGRFNARGFGWASVPDVCEREYTRARGNGHYRQGSRPDRSFSSNQHITRNGSNTPE